MVLSSLPAWCWLGWCCRDILSLVRSIIKGKINYFDESFLSQKEGDICECMVIFRALCRLHHTNQGFVVAKAGCPQNACRCGIYLTLLGLFNCKYFNFISLDRRPFITLKFQLIPSKLIKIRNDLVKGSVSLILLRCKKISLVYWCWSR